MTDLPALSARLRAGTVTPADLDAAADAAEQLAYLQRDYAEAFDRAAAMVGCLFPLSLPRDPRAAYQQAIEAAESVLKSEAERLRE
jgi:hypothetical protein